MVLPLTLLFVLATLPGCGRGGPPSPPARVNILLVTLDTTRADRLERGYTPTLTRLASEGLRFAAARSVAPLTLPAHASIMTGLLPPAHGLRLNGAGRLGGVATIAADLKAAGYGTRAVVGAFVLDRRFGLDAGFDEYDDRIDRDPDATDVLEAERPAHVVVDRALALLDEAPADRPWFLWVHLYDPHAPHAPPPDALGRAGGEAYGGEIAFADAELARLFARLAGRGDASRTATLVVGDHGESLGEHGEPTHGMLLFEPAIRVPLIVKAPGVAAGTVRRDLASLVDIAPTVRTLAGLAGMAGPGRNLLGPEGDAESYAETDYPAVAGWSPVRALVKDRWKLVDGGRPRLFDLLSDPGETTDVTAAEPLLARSMSARLEAIRAESSARPAPGNATLPADTVAKLRSLGYVAAPTPPRASGAGAPDPAEVMTAWAAFEAALTETRTGRSRGAIPALARLTQAHPESALFAATLARALAASGRSRDALERYRRAVRTWPGDWSLYHELAVVARGQGLSDEALRAEEAALALAPTEPLALNGNGLLLADAGRDAEAARAFEAAVTGDPTNAVYLANLGNARRGLGNLDGAADAYRRALERSPTLPDAANGLGVVLVQQQRPAEAVPYLEIAASDQGFVEAQLNLGIALEQAGNRARAAAQYRKVLAAPGPHPREHEAARALLAQLEGR